MALLASDLEASERFYLGVLRLPLVRRHFTEDGAHRSTWVGSEAGFIALERATEVGPRRDGAPGLHCLAIAVEPASRASWRERLESAGFPIVRETPFTLYVRDPDGILVGLSHYPSGA